MIDVGTVLWMVGLVLLAGAIGAAVAGLLGAVGAVGLVLIGVGVVVDVVAAPIAPAPARKREVI